MTSYDRCPYESRAIPITSVDRIALAARLAGLQPAPPERCSVLELGCAEGANLLAMAFHLEESRFVGVDASKVQIDLGLAARDRLGVDNLELRCGDFHAIGDELGTFDYVIVHGVLSWVDEPTRGRLLDLVCSYLAEDGIAYVSYNCAAGWAVKSELRACLLERTKGLASDEERVFKMRELLELLAATPLEKSSAYAASLAQQAEAAASRRDSYLLHEYLSEHNIAFRHREILALTEAHGLAFLAELAAASHIPGLEDRLRADLTERLDDALQAEELVDLMVGRAFRASLFTHLDRRPAEVENQAEAVADDAFFRADLRPAAKRLSLDRDVAETFVTASGMKISARNHLLKAALLELGKWWPRGLSLGEILERVNLLLELRRVHKPDETPTEEEIAGLRRDIVELWHLGHIEMALREPAVSVDASEHPRVSALSRLEAERGDVATNARHELIGLDAFERHLIAHLDGTRDAEALAERMRGHLEEGHIVLHREDGTEVDAETWAEALPGLIDSALLKLAAAGLLTPEP